MADIFPGGDGTRAGGVKFPAAEHEGLFGLTRAQKLTILLGFFVALAAVVGQAMVLAVVTLAVAAVLAFLPVGEYRGCEWAAVAWTYARRRILGRTCDLAQLGEESRGRGALRGYRFLSFESPLPGQSEIAVAVRRHRYTAVVECRGPSIALKDDGEVGAAYAAWGRFQRLAALASSRIARWSWTEIVCPSDPEAARQWFEQHRRVPAEHAAAASQRELLDDAGSSRQHRRSRLGLRHCRDQVDLVPTLSEVGHIVTATLSSAVTTRTQAMPLRTPARLARSPEFGGGVGCGRLGIAR